MVDPEPLDGELALASHWVVMTEEPTKPKSSCLPWVIFSIVVFVVCAYAFGADILESIIEFIFPNGLFQAKSV